MVQKNSVATDLVADVGTCSYNGYTFNGYTQYSVQSENIRDEADRTTLYLRHEITAQTVISSGNGADVGPNIEFIRDCLSKDGQSFYFAYKGFGEPIQLAPGGGLSGGQADVKWGPKTKITNWVPLGANGAVEVIWKCVVCIPACQCCAAYLGIMALNFDVNVSTDRNGFSTRRISGYLEIAQTRAADNSVPDSADNYWELIVFDPPLGFSREKERHLSKDKSRLDFTIVDSQIPSNNPLPPQCTLAEGRHSTRWSRSNGGTAMYRNQITMEITPQANINGQTAWNIFGTIVANRLKAIKSNGKLGVLIDELTAEEDLWGLPCSFSCSYRVLGSIQDFIGDNGLWTPLGTDWSQWKYSLQGSMFAPRGLAGLTLPANMDAIVDLCNQNPNSATGGSQQPIVPASARTPSFINQQPPPNGSYLKYQSGIDPIRHTPNVRQRSVQPSQDYDTYQDMSQATPFGFNQSGSSAPDVIITRGIPSVDFEFWGMAQRVGNPIPRPALQTVGGVNVYECGGRFKNFVVGNFFGQTVYGAVWAITYRAPTQPPVVEYPDNLQEGVTNNGQSAQPTS